MGNKYVGTGKLFFDGFSKVFKGPQSGGKVATIGGVKPKVGFSKATQKFKQNIKRTRKLKKINTTIRWKYNY